LPHAALTERGDSVRWHCRPPWTARIAEEALKFRAVVLAPRSQD